MKLGTLEHEDAAVEMAPMIDMVFLLLIFFIVASHFHRLEKVEIEIPVADKASIAKELKDRRTITVTEDEKIFVGNAERDLEQLGPLVEKARAEVPGLKIYLRADKNVQHKAVRDVMKACAAAGAAEIIFATYEE